MYLIYIYLCIYLFYIHLSIDYTWRQMGPETTKTGYHLLSMIYQYFYSSILIYLYTYLIFLIYLYMYLVPAGPRFLLHVYLVCHVSLIKTSKHVKEALYVILWFLYCLGFLSIEKILFLI